MQKRQRGEHGADMLTSSERARKPVQKASLEQTGFLDMVEASDIPAPEAEVVPLDDTSKGSPSGSDHEQPQASSTNLAGLVERPVSNTGLHSRFYDSLFRL